MSDTDEVYDDGDHFVACNNDYYDDNEIGEMTVTHLKQNLRKSQSSGPEIAITLTASEVLEKLQKDAEKLNEILALSLEECLLVLRCYGWNMDDTTLEMYLNERQIINNELGITDSIGECRNSVVLWSDKTMVCPICGDNIPAGRSVALAKCGHFLCVDCLTSNLLSAVKHGHDLIDKRCPIRSCRSIVGLSVFEMLLPPEEFERVKRNVLNNYISGHAHMRWCPNETSCEGVLCVSTLQESGPDVRCRKCGLEFCFNCLQAPHDPAKCEMLKGWNKLLQENELSLALIEKTTKACPNCSIRVEKNEGCNHMRCASCKHDYCWVCLGPWSDHNSQYYMCKKINVEKGEISKLFFNIYERWSVHRKSLSLEKKLLEEDSDYLQTLTGYFDKKKLEKVLAVLLDAQRVLIECRLTLMHGYVAFYFTELKHITFQFHIHQVEMLTEEISRLIYASPVRLDTGSIQDYATRAVHWCRVLKKAEFSS